MIFVTEGGQNGTDLRGDICRLLVTASHLSDQLALRPHLLQPLLARVQGGWILSHVRLLGHQSIRSLRDQRPVSTILRPLSLRQVRMSIIIR